MKDDNISRRAAIDAVECITSSMSVCLNEDECHGMKRMQRQAILELANMPSSQSDTCAGCKWEDAMSFGECCHCKRGYDDMYDGGELKGENEKC